MSNTNLSIPVCDIILTTVSVKLEKLDINLWCDISLDRRFGKEFVKLLCRSDKQYEISRIYDIFKTHCCLTSCVSNINNTQKVPVRPNL